MSSSTETPQRTSTPHHIISPVSPPGELRKRIVTSQNQPLNVQSGVFVNTGLVPVGRAPTQNPSNTSFQSGIRSVNTPFRDYR